MQKVLDLAEITRDNPFSFDNQVLKQTATGLNFRTYRGLRMYLITGSNDPGWLQAVYEGEFQLMHQKQAAYVFCRDMKKIMLGALQRDISNRPMIKLIANRKTKVVFEGGTAAEQEWKEYVSEVVAGL